MDISKQYIEMCDCPEIQTGRRHEPLDFWQYAPDGKHVDHWSQVWLPRQDQLQEMVGGWPTAGFIEWVGWLGAVYGLLCQAKPAGHLNLFLTGEQLWLAFVMKEKYDKVWKDKWVDRV